MQIEVTYRTGGAAGDAWDHDPNLRAEIKTKISEAMGRVLRTQGLIEWDATKTANGDFVVRGFLNAVPGTETMIQHTVDLNQVTQ
jgi:hypothetical protein